MRIACVATDKHKNLELLQVSAKRVDQSLDVLGMGVKWKNFGTKMKLVIDYTQRLPQNELVAVIDSYDTVLQRNPKEHEIFYFKHMKGKIVVGCESLCFMNCVEHKCKEEFKNQYPNGGFVMGTASSLCSFYRRLLTLCGYDDQIALGRYALLHCNTPNNFVLDLSMKFCVNVEPGKLSRLVYNKDEQCYYLKKNKNTLPPFLIHTPNIEADLSYRYYSVTNKLLGLSQKADWKNVVRLILKNVKEATTNPAFSDAVIVVSILLVLIVFLILVLFKFRQHRRRKRNSRYRFYKRLALLIASVICGLIIYIGIVTMLHVY